MIAGKKSSLQKAQTIVEFALMFPIILLILYGTMEFARYMQAYLTVQHAAREGARYAVTGRSITGNPDDRPASIVAKARAAASGLRIAPRSDTPAYEANPNLPNDLDVWLDPLDAVDPDTRPKPFTPEPITVTVTYNFEPLFPIRIPTVGGEITILPNLLTVVGQATMMVERIDRVTPVAEGTLPPSATAGPTSTSAPTPTTGPTFTQGPTSTSGPTSTLSPSATPTNTPLPTATGSCDVTVSSALNVAGDDKLRMGITNNSTQSAEITSITITWPTGGNNKKAKEVKLGGTKIWDAGSTSSPTNISGGWKGSAADRTLAGGGTYTLEIKFDRNDKKNSIDAGPYQVTVTFDLGCSVSSSISTPPTATITPTQACSISAGGITVDGKKLKWTLTNATASTEIISSISIDWPDNPSSQKLKKVKFGGNEIWEQGDSQPPTTIAGGWKGSTNDRSLPGSSSREARFEFEKELPGTGYLITITFESGCSVNGSK